MAHNPLVLRPYTSPSSQAGYLISKQTCWHFDAWLHVLHNHVFLHIETRAGGRKKLTGHTYLWTGERLQYCVQSLDAAERVTLQDKALWPRYDELNAMHWRYVPAMAARIPDGYRSRSVALHYIRAPSLDPMADSPNFFRYGECSGLTGTSTEQNV